jgi:hypothetical protein
MGFGPRELLPPSADYAIASGARQSADSLPTTAYQLPPLAPSLLYADSMGATCQGSEWKEYLTLSRSSFLHSAGVGGNLSISNRKIGVRIKRAEPPIGEMCRSDLRLDGRTQ